MKNLILLCICTLVVNTNAQNVGINSTGATPNTSAMLDIVASDKGLLIPRVTLSGTGDVTTITGAEPNGLLVYNTTAAGSGSTAVLANTFYFWDAAQSKWIAFNGSGGRDWALLGNAGTTAGTNFLGTTDDIDLQFKRNSILSGKLNNAETQTFFGVNAGLNTGTSGTSNSFFGHAAGKTNVSGVSNTAIGMNALTLATNSYNTAVGVNTLQALSSGSLNTFMGVSSGYYTTTGTGNTGVGMYAVEGGSGTGSGSYNTAIGFAAGSGYTGAGTQNYLPITTGSYNSFLGYSAAASSGTLVNATAIGAYSLVGQSNSVVIGSINTNNGATASANVGIGTTTPDTDFMLDVKKIDGTSGTGWGSTTAAGAIIGRTQSGLNFQSGVMGYNTGSDNNSAGVLGAYSSTQYGALGFRDNLGNVIGVVGNAGSGGTNIAGYLRATAGTTNIALRLGGSTSGTLDISPAATTSPHALIMPASQGAVSTVLTNDGAGNLSWGTNYGSNIQYANGTTSISTTSATYVDMAGATITFTPKHSTVYVYFTASGDVDVAAAGVQMGYVKCRITDATATTVYSKCVSIATDNDDVSGGNGAWNCAMVTQITGLTVGVPTTIKAQWCHSGTNPGTARCDPSTDYSHRSMMIMD